MSVAPHEQVKNGNVVRFIKDYWFILLAIVGMAMGWANFEAELRAEQKLNETQQKQIEITASALNTLDKKYIEDVTFIKTTLLELSKKIK